MCSNPSCRCFTVGPNNEKEKSSSIGVAAHILPASGNNGPRFEEGIRDDFISSIENGIWLCYSCSVLIDKDPLKFDKLILNEWKSQTESYVSSRLKDHTAVNNIHSKAMSFLKTLNGNALISETLIELFDFSIQYRLETLRHICSREINGWYFEELSQLEIEKIPEYRKAIVVQTFGDVNRSSGIRSADHFISELKRLPEAYEQNYVFHEPFDELEKWSKEEFLEPKVLKQIIERENLQFNDGSKIDKESYIWYTTNTVNGIVSNCKKFLKREIMEIVSK